MYVLPAAENDNDFYQYMLNFPACGPCGWVINIFQRLFSASRLFSADNLFLHKLQLFFSSEGEQLYPAQVFYFRENIFYVH